MLVLGWALGVVRPPGGGFGLGRQASAARILGILFAAICSPMPEPPAGAEEALASIADEMIEA